MQRWSALQHELIPEIRVDVGMLTPKLEKVIHTLEWLRIEEFVAASWCGVGRPPHDRAWLAKAVLGLGTTSGLIERLTIDRVLRRICGFPLCKKLPSESTFSRAFDELSEGKLAKRVHEALIQEYLGETLIGHLSRDGTAIHARERPARSARTGKAPASTPPPRRQRGGPGAAKMSTPAKASPLAQQRSQTLPQMLAEIPTVCDRGTKCNAQGYKVSWNGYKRHLDTADCGVPISALLSSASMHDSLAAMPLALMSAQRATNCYDLMDASYCSGVLREASRELGHVPLIDHNLRQGEKIEFASAEALRYNEHERTAAERSNARLKDEFGGMT